MTLNERDRAYRRALGLPDDAPLPKQLGTVSNAGGRSKNGSRGGRRIPVFGQTKQEKTS